MIGYKAILNTGYDIYDRRRYIVSGKYSVPANTKHRQLEISKHGFWVGKNIMKCLALYVDYDIEKIVFLEVKILGKIEENEFVKNLIMTDEIEIIRSLPEEELYPIFSNKKMN